MIIWAMVGRRQGARRATLVVAQVDAPSDDVLATQMIAQPDDAGTTQRAGTSSAPTTMQSPNNDFSGPFSTPWRRGRRLRS